MKILIVGLGLIGGSMAKALRRAGYAPDGSDLPAVEQAALAQGVIGRAARGPPLWRRDAPTRRARVRRRSRSAA